MFLLGNIKMFPILNMNKSLYRVSDWIPQYSAHSPSASFFNYSLTAPELLWAGCPDDRGNLYRSPTPVPLLSFRLSGPRHPSGWLAISKFASHSSNVSFDSFMPSGDCQFYYPVTHSSVFSCTLFYFLRKLLNYFIFVSECTDC